jgi:hypothetical protein
LTQEALNPESKPAERISALKALGSVAELGVFVERKEIRTIKDSATAKADLMAKLKQAIKDKNRTIDNDINSLMDEISDKNSDLENNFDTQVLVAGPPPGGQPNSSGVDATILHTIVAERLQTENENDSQTTEGGG